MNLPGFLDLGAGFAKHFRVKPALDDESRRSRAISIHSRCSPGAKR
jgi:hypothetical protein